MTLTELRPVTEAASRGPAPERQVRPPGIRRRATALIPTEVALVVLTLVTTASYARVFEGWEWFRQLGTLAVASHLLAIACRRAGWGVVTSTVAGLAGLTVALSLVFYQSVSAVGLPTRSTWRLAGDDLSTAWDAFANAVPLIPAERGYLLAAGVGVWLAAWFADGFAFRARAGFEAVLPAGILFVFASAVAADRLRVVFAALWLATTFVVLLLHRVLRQETSSGWLAASRNPSPTPPALRVGGAIALIAVVAGGIAGPMLPGAGDKALVDTTNDSTSRTTLSPIVELKGRLTGQSTVEAFTVQSAVPSYWRITALPDFNGRTWTSRAKVRDADGTLGGGFDESIGGTEVQQTFTITGLKQIWLPAAFAPINVSGADGITYDSKSSSLVSKEDDPRGLTYQVTSVIPNFPVEVLQAAVAPATGDVADRNLLLPDDFPAELVDEAQRIVDDAGARTPYDKALALQSFFRDNFQYDLSFRAGHSDEIIQQFLDERRGYCEQFAGTYAAFARALGLPARVAIGFTHGEVQPDGSYKVLGRHAHAWPEVYFEGVGWVQFEPTPGRGNPAAVQYTGVQPAQDDGGGGAGAPATTTTIVTASTLPTGAEVPPEDLAGASSTTLAPQQVAGSSGGGPRWLLRLGLVVLVAVGVAMAWLAGLAALRRARRDQRRRHAGSPADRVLVAWAEAAETLRRTGKGPAPSETPLEYADRAGRSAGVPTEAFHQLALDATMAGYAADGVDPDAVQRSTATVAAIEHSIHERTPFTERLRWAADPRTAFAGLFTTSGERATAGHSS